MFSRREVEAGHPVAALAQPDQMRAGAAGDVEHGLDGPLRIGAEAVDEEVHLRFRFMSKAIS